MKIYRIFDALGDSIILSTYFKAYDIKKVYYNRAELKTLIEVLDFYGVERPEFIKVPERINDNMVKVVKDLKRDKIKLINPKSKSETCSYVTVQLKTNSDGAQDRSITMDDALSHMPKDFKHIHDVKECKTILDLYSTLSQSKAHVTIDSGSAWASASIGVPTTIISKNSIYFSDAYHYMRYIETHKNVVVYQQNGEGVTIPSGKEYLNAALDNGVNVDNYQNYMERIK